MAKRGRPTKEQALINQHKTKLRKDNSHFGEFILPNNSGDHKKSIKRDTPTQDTDLVNKKYVDDNKTTPAGSDGEVQFNDSGSFTADDGLVWDNTNKRLGIGTNTPTDEVHVYKNSAGAVDLLVENPNTGASARARLRLKVGGTNLFNVYGVPTAGGQYTVFQAGGGGGFQISSLGNQSYNVDFGGSGSNYRYDWKSNMVQLMRLDTYNGLTVEKDLIVSGNVGVNQSNPQAKLDVNNSFRYTDGNETKGYILTSDADGDATWMENYSEKSWAFKSPSYAIGTFYYGGYYDFGATDNDFNPTINHGTALASYAAHFFVVAAAGGGLGIDTVLTVSGTSIDDNGSRTPLDSETLTLDDAGAAGAYYETSKKWIGTVGIVKTSGPDLLCNYGFCKYWNNANTDFQVNGIEVTWLGGANDPAANFLIRHHKATGWTYNAGATPTPPTAIADMNTDHNTEIGIVNGENGAWKRTNLVKNIMGGDGEGTILEVVTTANKAFDLGNILMKINPQ